MRKTKTPTNRVVQRVVRLSEEEDLAIQAKASEFGYATSASFLRAIGLEKPMPAGKKIEREFQRLIWKQVAGIGRNINQIAFKLNLGTQSTPNELKAVLDEIRALRIDLEKIGLEKT